MDPIYIILYAVIVTTVLTVLFGRRRQLSSDVRRLSWILVVVGLATLLAVVVLYSSR